jgi:DNA-directed RNA polymerase subunit RPC12/RpoP
MRSVVYQCLACGKEATPAVPVLPPAKWEWDQRQVPRMLCPTCGCACAPQEWRLVAFEVCDRHKGNGMSIEKLAHDLWARCPNSLECLAQRLYQADCEQTQAVMPKCLAAIHSRLTHIERQLDPPATPAPDRPRARRAGRPLTNTSPAK